MKIHNNLLAAICLIIAGSIVLSSPGMAVFFTIVGLMIVTF